MTLTKVDIIEAVANKCGFSKLEAADLVETIINTVKENLCDGNNVKISGFGNFVLSDKASRRGRNPQTGDAMTITDRRVMKFKVSQVLREAIRTGRLPTGSQTDDED